MHIVDLNLFRTSLTTVISWLIFTSQLEKGAKDCLPMHQCLKGVISPRYWDTDTIALNLQHAYNGFPDNPKWAEGVLTKLLAQNRNRPILPGCEFVRKKSGLQKLVYDQFMS